ncbi:probable ATP-dependent RNA helicase CG8611 [Aricia agestis]|uniref:probable ATP-dependent RNA helicase CG8611 n=1 Tax=Aricia agestis TaxID=91739 RepID=UPI001C208847|nr:probable ATP-dependent RNA helicase CG8611 [Aricia agestis]
MDDLQLNISVSKKNNNKANRQRVDQQSNGYKFKSKPDFSGKIFARKRHINVDRANLNYKPGEPQNKKFKQNEPQVSNNSTPAPEKRDLASQLRDLSESKGKFANKNYQDIHDELQIKQKPKGSWISSLFKNNPEVPRVGQKAVKPVVEKVFSGTTFADLNVHPHSIANLKQNLNLTELMTVQQKSIPIILQGRDVLIRSQTGSGKTLAYALPLIEGLQAIRPKINRHDGVRVVVVVPTRELAVQTYELFVKLTKPFIWIVPGLLSGGQKRKAEKARLRKGLSILVGTPGRINDHLRHTHSLNFSKTGCLILDEADRLLDMGYEKDVAAIVKAIEDHKRAATYDPLALVKQSFNKKAADETEENQDTEQVENEVTDVTNNTEHPLTQVFMTKERQTILLSATLTKAVENLAGITMKDPVFVDTSEGKALVADSLQKEKDHMKNKNIEKLVQKDKSNKSIENTKPEVPILKQEVVAETKSSEEEQAKTESQPVIEMRGKLKAFSGSFFPELFENKEKTDEPKVAKPQKVANNAENKDDSDSDSDYEYFKVQNLNDNKVQTVTNGNKEESEEEDVEKPNVFLQAIKSAVTEDELVLPATVNQTFLVIPMKLRLVTLCSLIIEHCILNKKGGKMIVFMATLEMVDYHSELIETVLTGKKFKKKKDSKSKEAKGKKRKADNSDEEDGSDSDGSNSEFEVDYEIPEEGSLVPVDLDVFSLHGSMPHERRIEVFKQFRTAKRGLLICTDVAARGLDVPRVDLVLQYCAPASATDYVHRVGRTGRAAHVGAAVMFLLPSETEFVRHLEQKRIRLRQDDESKSLEALRTVAPTAATMQRAAIAVQSRLEYTAHSSKEWLARASRAFTSWVRFYSGYPREVREMLDARKLHLGHAAKAFALRETPAALAKRARSDPKLKKEKPVNRLTVREEDEKKRPGFPKMKVSMFGGKVFNKQSSMHTASEFDSGLPPVDTYTKKKKKN